MINADYEADNDFRADSFHEPLRQALQNGPFILVQARFGTRDIIDVRILDICLWFKIHKVDRIYSGPPTKYSLTANVNIPSAAASS